MSNFGKSYDNWLDENDHRANDYEYAFQEAREQFLATKYNVQYPDVFLETLYEIEISTKCQCLADALALGEKGFAELGKVFYMAVSEHLESMARIDARKQAEAIQDF